ncbi:MAG: hypothetical protein ACE1ZC_06010 [Nitrososphaerales archaeon]|nr:hypothetical protein [Nitrososphaerota archaeon]
MIAGAYVLQPILLIARAFRSIRLNREINQTTSEAKKAGGIVDLVDWKN